MNINGAVFEKETDPRLDNSRVIRAPRGPQLTCKNWVTEAAYRMIQNNLDPEVAEHPQHLVVYGGIGRAARNWECFDQILESLRNLNEDESLLIQSGKPVGVFKTHPNAPRVLLAVARFTAMGFANSASRAALNSIKRRSSFSLSRRRAQASRLS